MPVDSFILNEDGVKKGGGKSVFWSHYNDIKTFVVDSDESAGYRVIRLTCVTKKGFNLTKPVTEMRFPLGLSLSPILALLRDNGVAEANEQPL